MPPNAAKYTGIDSRILDAAIELFSSHGYKGTTTREIALLAGVSENSLFRHFQHKEGIFWAALESRVSNVSMRRELREGLQKQKSLEIVLPQLLEYLSYIVIHQSELIKLLSVAFLELPEKTEILCGRYLSPIILDLSRYIARSTGTKELSAFESTLLAAAFVSAPVFHPIYYRLASGDQPSPLPDAKDRVRAYTNLWLSVLNKQISPGRGADAEHSESGVPAQT
jgi:AcrR family transcriptional regulator